MAGSFVLVLHTHLPYVIRHGRWPHGLEWLCEAAAECYIPLLNQCNELRDEGISPRITISFSPVLLEQLADEDFPSLFEGFLNERIEAASKDVDYFRSRPEEREFVPVAAFWQEWYRSRLQDFTERYGRNLVAAFRDLRDAGAIAVQTCGATHGYFPLLGYDESIHGQVQVALDVHWRHFNSRPRGIWMPECAYRPGGFRKPPMPTDDVPDGFRLGVEQIIAAGGMDHTMVDAHIVRAGEPVNWYVSRFTGKGGSEGSSGLPLNDPRSLYDIYKIYSSTDPAYGSVSVFARDVDTALRVWSGSSGYPGNESYLEFHKKHHRSGHRYWKVTGKESDLADKRMYHPAAAREQVRRDAEDFVLHVERVMEEYQAATGCEGTLTLPFDTELFGHWWFEGPLFVGEVIRLLSRRQQVQPRTTPEEVDRRGPGLSVTLPEGSWGDGGDHRVWLNEETAWTWPIIWKAERQFLELVRSRNRENLLEERALKQMGRELLLLQASDWQFLITTGTATDYAEERIREHAEGLELIGDYVRSLRSGVERLDLFDELCRLETKDRLFPHLDLDHWVWKNAEEALGAPREK
ncbi:MAG: 1,4-alpha-glucan branching protein domain-containing protein [Candidatus Kapaibacterium sp.]